MSKHKSFTDLIQKTAELTHQLESVYKELSPEDRHAPKFVNPVEKQLNTLFLKFQMTFWKKEAEKQDKLQAEQRKHQQIQMNEMIVKQSLEKIKKEEAPKPEMKVIKKPDVIEKPKA